MNHFLIQYIPTTVSPRSNPPNTCPTFPLYPDPLPLRFSSEKIKLPRDHYQAVQNKIQ